VRNALQATAQPVTAAVGGEPLAFWQVGYGHVSLGAAVDLVRGANVAKRISSAQAAADQRVLGAAGSTVTRSDFWTWDAPRAAVAGSDSRSFTADVPARTTQLKVTLAHPSLYAAGENGMVYTVTVIDGAGQVLGKTTEAASGSGTSSLLIDVAAAAAHAGTYTFQVSGQRAASDPDTLDSESALGRTVVLQVAQSRAQ
jgi:serine protease AprX